jgi:hypothetical protein
MAAERGARAIVTCGCNNQQIGTNGAGGLLVAV